MCRRRRRDDQLNITSDRDHGTDGVSERKNGKMENWNNMIISTRRIRQQHCIDHKHNLVSTLTFPSESYLSRQSSIYLRAATFLTQPASHCPWVVLYCTSELSLDLI